MPPLHALSMDENVRVAGAGASGPEAQQRGTVFSAGRVGAVAGARPPGRHRRRQRARHQPPLPAAGGERRTA